MAENLTFRPRRSEIWLARSVRELENLEKALTGSPYYSKNLESNSGRSATLSGLVRRQPAFPVKWASGPPRASIFIADPGSRATPHASAAAGDHHPPTPPADRSPTTPTCPPHPTAHPPSPTAQPHRNAPASGHPTARHHPTARRITAEPSVKSSPPSRAERPPPAKHLPSTRRHPPPSARLLHIRPPEPPPKAEPAADPGRRAAGRLPAAPAARPPVRPSARRDRTPPSRLPHPPATNTLYSLCTQCGAELVLSVHSR